MAKRTFSQKGGASFLMWGGLLLVVILLFSMYRVKEGFGCNRNYECTIEGDTCTSHGKDKIKIPLICKNIRGSLKWEEY